MSDQDYYTLEFPDSSFELPKPDLEPEPPPEPPVQQAGNVHSCYVCGAYFHPDSRVARYERATYFISVHDYCQLYITPPKAHRLR